MSDISITAASVLKSNNGNVASGIIASGTTITAGKALYQLTDGTLGLADSNGSAPANTFAGISLTGGGAGQPITYCSSDPAFVLGGSVTSGDRVYLSNTPGGLTVASGDLASGSTVILVGIATSSTTINLSPVTGGTI